MRKKFANSLDNGVLSCVMAGQGRGEECEDRWLIIDLIDGLLSFIN
jgi:hypothetical protein